MCGIFFNHWKVVILFDNNRDDKECITAEFYPDGIKLALTNRLKSYGQLHPYLEENREPDGPFFIQYQN